MNLRIMCVLLCVCVATGRNDHHGKLTEQEEDQQVEFLESSIFTATDKSSDPSAAPETTTIESAASVSTPDPAGPDPENVTSPALTLAPSVPTPAPSPPPPPPTPSPPPPPAPSPPPPPAPSPPPPPAPSPPPPPPPPPPPENTTTPTSTTTTPTSALNVVPSTTPTPVNTTSRAPGISVSTTPTNATTTSTPLKITACSPYPTPGSTAICTNIIPTNSTILLTSNKDSIAGQSDNIDAYNDDRGLTDDSGHRDNDDSRSADSTGNDPGEPLNTVDVKADNDDKNNAVNLPFTDNEKFNATRSTPTPPFPTTKTPKETGSIPPITTPTATPNDTEATITITIPTKGRSTIGSTTVTPTKTQNKTDVIPTTTNLLSFTEKGFTTGKGNLWRAIKCESLQYKAAPDCVVAVPSQVFYPWDVFRTTYEIIMAELKTRYTALPLDTPELDGVRVFCGGMKELKLALRWCYLLLPNTTSILPIPQSSVSFLLDKGRYAFAENWMADAVEVRCPAISKFWIRRYDPLRCASNNPTCLDNTPDFLAELDKTNIPEAVNVTASW